MRTGEPKMSRVRFFRTISTVLLPALAVLLGGSILISGWAMPSDEPMTAAAYEADPAAMIEGYRHVEVASVSDAIEQTLHEKHYMSHRMQSIFPTKFAGFAVTVKLNKEENHDPDALNGMLQAIDTGKP